MAAIEEKYRDLDCKGSIGVVDCMEIRWKNCPFQLKGQYHSSREGHLATLQVEACTDHDLNVYHWFSGRCGTNKDKTMVEMSPLFRKIMSGTYNFKLDSSYTTGSLQTVRDVPYFLVDGIYPNWPIFVKPIHKTDSLSQSKFTVKQEAVRKDV